MLVVYRCETVEQQRWRSRGVEANNRDYENGTSERRVAERVVFATPERVRCSVLGK